MEIKQNENAVINWNSTEVISIAMLTLESNLTQLSYVCLFWTTTNKLGAHELRQNRRAQIVESNSPFQMAHIVACNHIFSLPSQCL